MNPVQFNRVEELLPHAGQMVLITGVASWGDGCADVYVDQDGTSLFADSDGHVPAWVGMEYMAQAIGVYAGFQARSRQRPIRPGFLLGARRYSVYTDSFLKNTRLDIRVETVLHEEHGIALFSCTISSQGRLLADAEIKVIQPENIEQVLRGSES